MTKEKGFDKLVDIRGVWATASNATTDQEELFRLCEQYIVDMEETLYQVLAPSHPPPPQPRIRP